MFCARTVQELQKCIDVMKLKQKSLKECAVADVVRHSEGFCALSVEVPGLVQVYLTLLAVHSLKRPLRAGEERCALVVRARAVISNYDVQPPASLMLRLQKAATSKAK